MSNSVRKRRFTLMELLAVVAIIAMLAAMLMPALQRVRAAAWQTACTSNFRQTGMAYRMYARDYNGQVPQPTFTDHLWLDGWNWWGTPVYLDGTTGYTNYRYDISVGQGPVDRGILYGQGYSETPQVFYCPADTARWNSHKHRYLPSNWPQRQTRTNTSSRLNRYLWADPGWDGGSAIANFRWEPWTTGRSIPFRHHLPYPYNPAPSSSGARRYQRLYHWGGRAITSDRVTKQSCSLVWSSNHKSSGPAGIRGWNILYADGGVQWYGLADTINWWHEVNYRIWWTTSTAWVNQPHSSTMLSSESRGDAPVIFWDIADRRRGYGP